jgi:ABC-2 type transport system permease protein
VARIGYGVAWPRELAGFAVAGLLTTAALMAIGLFIAAVAPTGNVARGIGAIAFYPMMFFAGLWLPIPNMPRVLQHISHATPLGAAVPALQNATLGHWPTSLQLLTLAAYAVAFGLAAARLFRWE